MIEIRVKRDALDGDLRARMITGDEKIAAAQAELKELQAKVDAGTTKIKEAFAVFKRVSITSIADGHKRSGPLTVGYGTSPDKIGPDLGFGLAQKIDAPILLIKTRMMNEAVRDVLKYLKKHHPEYDAGAGYEIAGFV